MAATDELRSLPGAEAVLAVQGGSLPQPDQLCGPYAARAALHALRLPQVPGLVALAQAAGTRVWPADDPSGRPAGAPLVTTGLADLPRADDPARAGTDATGLAAGIAAATGGAVAVLPAAAGTPEATLALLTRLRDAAYPIAVVANLRTGPVLRGTGHTGWDVGHFVCLWALGPDEGAATRVGIADSYAELGAPSMPPGCRVVTLGDLAEALASPPGRGLLLLVPAGDADAAGRDIAASGLARRLWAT